MASVSDCFLRRTCTACKTGNCTWLFLKNQKHLCAISSDGIDGVLAAVEWDGDCDEPFCYPETEVPKVVYNQDAGISMLPFLVGVGAGCAGILLIIYMMSKCLGRVRGRNLWNRILNEDWNRNLRFPWFPPIFGFLTAGSNFFFEFEPGLISLMVFLGLAAGVMGVLLIRYLWRHCFRQGVVQNEDVAQNQTANRNEDQVGNANAPVPWVPPIVGFLARRREQEMTDALVVLEGQELIEMQRRLRNLRRDQEEGHGPGLVEEVRMGFENLRLSARAGQPNVLGLANPLYDPNEEAGIHLVADGNRVEAGRIADPVDIPAPNEPAVLEIVAEVPAVNLAEVGARRRRREEVILLDDLEGVSGYGAVRNGEDLAPRLPQNV